MSVPPSPAPSSPSRRAVLTGLAGGLAATSGCVERFRTVMGRQRPDPVTLSIKTVPADDDPFALRIARELSKWYQAAGIDAQVQPVAADELRRQVLINHEFDVFVARYPDRTVDPDSLYALLHSRFAGEPGWQNPFGFADLSVDELLTEQRVATGAARRRAVEDLQETLARQHPFTVLAFPEVIRAVRTDRFEGYVTTDVSSPFGVLQVAPADARADVIRATTTNEEVTMLLNPLIASRRSGATVTELIYDPLARWSGDDLVPWCAADWTWTDGGVLDVTLRPDLTFHDGEPLTADDVEFTYRFLRDTSLGEGDQAAPPMAYRGASTLTDSVSALGQHTVRFDFGDRSDAVAGRALTVPILPRHVWTEWTHEATVAGLDMGDGSTEALVTNNVPPVGSGPLAFSDATRNERLVLVRYDDHFLHAESGPDPSGDLPGTVAGGAAFEELVVQHVGSGPSAVELVEAGDADCTLSGVGPEVVRRIGRNDDLELLVDPSDSFYFAGFNARRSPLGNPRFRQLLARLVDRRHLVQSVFSSFASPAVTPLAGTEWEADAVAWEGQAPQAPFLGTRGSVDEAGARAAFREAGYQYDEDGRLLGN